MHISVYLGDGEQAEARKRALETMARKAGYVWDDRPSIGRWLCALADEELKEAAMRQLPQIEVRDTQVVLHNLKIETAMGVIDRGYSLAITLKRDSQETLVDALNLLVTDKQSATWCIDQCERLAERLTQQGSYTPGQILRLLHCGFRPLAELGIPTPPEHKHATAVELKAFHERTGKPMIYQENEAWREYAIAVNAWIKEYPTLAEDYDCMPQDENWVPV